MWPMKKLGPKGKQTGAHFKEETDFSRPSMRAAWLLFRDDQGQRMLSQGRWEGLHAGHAHHLPRGLGGNHMTGS